MTPKDAHNLGFSHDFKHVRSATVDYSPDNPNDANRKN